TLQSIKSAVRWIPQRQHREYFQYRGLCEFIRPTGVTSPMTAAGPFISPVRTPGTAFKTWATLILLPPSTLPITSISWQDIITTSSGSGGGNCPNGPKGKAHKPDTARHTHGNAPDPATPWTTSQNSISRSSTTITSNG